MPGIQARQGLIAAGLAVSLEAASYTASRHDGVRFLPLTGPPLRASIQLTWTDLRPDPRRDMFIEIAREIAGPPPQDHARAEPHRPKLTPGALGASDTDIVGLAKRRRAGRVERLPAISLAAMTAPHGQP